MSHFILIATLGALAAGRPAPSLAVAPYVAARDTVATSLGVRLDSALRAAELRGFSGVVRVEQGGVLLLEKGYGLANRARRLPFGGSTVVQIGSNTKDFTLVALLRLQARHRLSLRDSLGKFFPDAPTDKRGITLQQLVDHRGGFPIGFGGDFESISRSAFVRRALAAPLRAPPGTREIYSNAGYALLAAVIEQVTGSSYDHHVRDDILAPLGLVNTGYHLPGFSPARLAHGYRGDRDEGNIVEKPHAADGPYWNLRGNGGMVSTVGDMHAFYRALFEGDRLLSPVDRGDRFNANEAVQLAGSDLVNFFSFERLPAERLELIIATNSAEFRAPMVREALGSVLGLRKQAPRGGDGPAGPPEGARAPTAAATALVRGFFTAVNSADSAAVRRFILAHFAQDGGPSVDERLERFTSMRERLGVLTPGAMWMDDEGAVNMSVSTAQEGPATFIFETNGDNPPRLRAVKVLVGG